MWEGISSCGKVDSFVWTERHKEKVCGELHGGKQVDESRVMSIQHHTISLERILCNESNIFQQMGLMRLVWKIWAERKKRERTSYDWRISSIFFCSQNRTWSTAVNISVNCDAERKIAIGNYIPIAAVIETDTLVTQCFTQKVFVARQNKTTRKPWFGGRGNSAICMHTEGDS